MSEEKVNKKNHFIFLRKRFTDAFFSLNSRSVFLVADMQLYRVINLDWEKVLSFCSQLLPLTGLEIVFFCSAMFDVFCIKILLV